MRITFYHRSFYRFFHLPVTHSQPSLTAIIGKSSSLTWSIALLSIALMGLFDSGCSGPKISGIQERAALNDENYISWIRQQIDDQVSLPDARADIKPAQGKVVRWNGDIVDIWQDRLLIAQEGGGVGWNHFVLFLDHPLPQVSTVKDLIQTVSSGDGIYAAGRILDMRTIILRSGSDLTIPHLECLIISKENDRQFNRPVWVTDDR